MYTAPGATETVAMADSSSVVVVGGALGGFLVLLLTLAAIMILIIVYLGYQLRQVHKPGSIVHNGEGCRNYHIYDIIMSNLQSCVARKFYNHVASSLFYR